MMFVQKIIRALSFASVLVCVVATTAYSKPPFIDTAFVLVGDPRAATNDAFKNEFPTKHSVIEWQLKEGSLFLGGTLGGQNNKRTNFLDYIYLQKLNLDPGQLELSLLEQAHKQNKDIEDYFLHYIEDTIAKPTKLPPQDGNPLFGAPIISGYTNNWLHAGFPLKFGKANGADIFERWKEGGALYVYSFDKFNEIHLNLVEQHTKTPGKVIVELPAAIDSTGYVTTWQKAPITDDLTSGLSQSGIIRFAMPRKWQIAATHTGSGLSYNHGQFFGDQRLRHGAKLFVVRLRWQPGHAGQPRPRLNAVSLRPRLIEQDGIIQIPGFDPQNDLDNNGHIDDKEFATRTNKDASARFKYEARITPLAPPHGGREGWTYANLFNAELVKKVSAHYAKSFAANGYNGAYNDEFFLRPSQAALGLIHGGRILENPEITPISNAFNAMHNLAFLEAFRQLKSPDDGQTRLHVSANTNHQSLLGSPSDLPFSGVLDSVLRENFLTVSTGLIAYSGLLMTGDIYALGPQMKVVLQAQPRQGRIEQSGNSKNNWDKDHEALVAQSFLLHQKGSTLFSYWTRSFWYGGGLTSKHDYYIDGVPRVAAFYPQQFLHAPLGPPTNIVPASHQPAPILVRRKDQFIEIGNSMSQALTFPVADQQITYPNQPTGLYFIHQSDEKHHETNLPVKAILARNFEQGIVLFATSTFGRDFSYLDKSPITVVLPRAMRRLRSDGSYTAPITEITLSGYEGAILINAR